MLARVEVICPKLLGGATLELPRVHWPNPRWSPVGNCPPCQYAQDLCEDPCYEHLTDASGELTDAGRACTGRCEATSMACRKRCMGM